MASGADFQADVSFVGRTGLELAAASANDFNDVIGGVNSGFHGFPGPRIAQKQDARSGDQPAAGVFCLTRLGSQRREAPVHGNGGLATDRSLND